MKRIARIITSIVIVTVIGCNRESCSTRGPDTVAQKPETSSAAKVSQAAGAGVWRNVDVHNRVGGENNVRDEAALAEELLPMTSDGTLTNDYSCGWLDGLMVWQVPFGWNEKGTTGASDPFNTFGTILQEFYIDRWGQTTVQKFGNRATRLLNGRRFLNSREIK